MCNFKIWQNRGTKIADLEIGVSKSKFFKNRGTKTAIKPKIKRYKLFSVCMVAIKIEGVNWFYQINFY
jgi:hypothetical protein